MSGSSRGEVQVVDEGLYAIKRWIDHKWDLLIFSMLLFRFWRSCVLDAGACTTGGGCGKCE